MSIQIKRKEQIEVKEVTIVTSGSDEPTEPAIKLGQFTFASPGITGPEFHAALRKASKPVRDMAAEARRQHKAGETEEF